MHLAGRFENLVREIFEDLCDALAGECAEFSHLPKQMQANLVKYMADVNLLSTQVWTCGEQCGGPC
jgi:hypothetical protein